MTAFFLASATAFAIWAHYVGSIFGQLLFALLFLPIGPLAVIGLLFLMMWSLLFLVGAYLGSRMRTRVMSR